MRRLSESEGLLIFSHPIHFMEDAYTIMTDDELEHSLERSKSSAEQRLETYVAAKVAKDSNYSQVIQESVLGPDYATVDDVETELDDALDEYVQAWEEADRRDTDFSDHRLETDEVISRTTEWLEELEIEAESSTVT